jgi:hypothetical protein
LKGDPSETNSRSIPIDSSHGRTYCHYARCLPEEHRYGTSREPFMRIALPQEVVYDDSLANPRIVTTSSTGATGVIGSLAESARQGCHGGP